MSPLAIKTIVFLGGSFLTISNYPKTKQYMMRDFGLDRGHCALVVLVALMAFLFALSQWNLQESD